jgi:hypothetical protein
MLFSLQIWFAVIAILNNAQAQFLAFDFRFDSRFSSREVSALPALQTSRTTPLTQVSTLSLLRTWLHTRVGLRFMSLSGGGRWVRLNSLAKRLAKFSEIVVTISLAETAASAAMKCGVVSAMRRFTPCMASCASSSEMPSPKMPMLAWLKRP